MEISVKESQIEEVMAEIKSKQTSEESAFSSCPDCAVLVCGGRCFKCSNSYCGYSKCS